MRTAASAAMLLGTFAGLWWLQRRRPLRAPTQPTAPRFVRNAAIGALAAAVVGTLEAPLTSAVARAVERRQLGLVPRSVPARWRMPAALLLLDYSLYGWHILLHRVPALWRWHRVHHADRDLDASTALRFHAMEMAWSLPWRLGQIVLIGAGPRTMSLWARLTAASVLFHHSNVRLPKKLERLLGLFVMTPSRHGIHHADVQVLQASNLSSGLTVWDALHGTVRTDVPQARIRIGLPAEPKETA